MSTRVMSIRLSYSTIAYCYLLNEKADINQHGKAVSSVISETVESIISASRKLYDIPELSETEARAVIESYVAKLPGFDAADIVAELQNKSNGKSAWKEETRPDKPSAQPEPEAQEQPLSATKLEVFDKCPRKFDFKPIEVSVSSEYDDEFDIDPELRSTSGRIPPATVEDVVDQTAQALVDQDEKDLLDAVSVGAVERVSPQAVETQTPKCPWEGANTFDASSKILQDDELYKEAMSIDPLMGLAVRVVYAVLPHDIWGSDMAIKLVKKTYADYKKWEEKYGSEAK